MTLETLADIPELAGEDHSRRVSAVPLRNLTRAGYNPNVMHLPQATTSNSPHLIMIDRFYTQLREAVIEREGILNLVEIGE